MNRLLFGIFVLIMATSCENSSSETIDTDVVKNPQTASTESADNVLLPEMTFEQELYDFGTITQGEKVHITYEFENTGDADLVISTARGSCGCTVPDWPKEPIKPGEKGTIKVVFNSDGKSGNQHKKVFISANTQPSQNEVALKGEILAPSVEE